MRDIREADILRTCLTWLQLQGIYCWRQNQGAISGVSKGKRRFFRFASATGISDSAMLRGVKTQGASATTYSILMRAKSRTVRFIRASHDLKNKTIRLRSDNREHRI